MSQFLYCRLLKTAHLLRVLERRLRERESRKGRWLRVRETSSL